MDPNEERPPASGRSCRVSPLFQNDGDRLRLARTDFTEQAGSWKTSGFSKLIWALLGLLLVVLAGSAMWSGEREPKQIVRAETAPIAGLAAEDEAPPEELVPLALEEPAEVRTVEVRPVVLQPKAQPPAAKQARRAPGKTKAAARAKPRKKPISSPVKPAALASAPVPPDNDVALLTALVTHAKARAAPVPAVIKPKACKALRGKAGTRKQSSACTPLQGKAKKRG